MTDPRVELIGHPQHRFISVHLRTSVAKKSFPAGLPARVGRFVWIRGCERLHAIAVLDAGRGRDSPGTSCAARSSVFLSPRKKGEGSSPQRRSRIALRAKRRDLPVRLTRSFFLVPLRWKCGRSHVHKRWAGDARQCLVAALRRSYRGSAPWWLNWTFPACGRG